MFRPSEPADKFLRLQVLEDIRVLVPLPFPIDTGALTWPAVVLPSDIQRVHQAANDLCRLLAARAPSVQML